MLHVLHVLHVLHICDAGFMRNEVTFCAFVNVGCRDLPSSKWIGDVAMKVIVFGATGMVGQSVFRECLLDPEITHVIVVGRHPIPVNHLKVQQHVLHDMSDISSIVERISGYDACFFGLGTSAAGKTEHQYKLITLDLTLAIARTLSKYHPNLTFHYVSGAGTDRSEKGRSMWARIKGRTENDLLALPFQAAYMYRPGAILPYHGIRSRTRWYRIMYSILKPLYPVLRRMKSVLTTEEFGKAMIIVAKKGSPKNILEAKDIKHIAKSV